MPLCAVFRIQEPYFSFINRKASPFLSRSDSLVSLIHLAAASGEAVAEIEIRFSFELEARREHGLKRRKTMSTKKAKADKNINSQASLRGETQQKHGQQENDKSSPKRKIAVAKKKELIEKSAKAKEIIELSRSLAKTPEEIQAADDLTVNKVLVMMYQEETGCKDFQVFSAWKSRGYSIIKGSVGFRVWSTPRQITEKSNNEKGEKVEGDSYEFWPVCHLFNEDQVEERSDES